LFNLGKKTYFRRILVKIPIAQNPSAKIRDWYIYVCWGEESMKLHNKQDQSIAGSGMYTNIL